MENPMLPTYSDVRAYSVPSFSLRRTVVLSLLALGTAAIFAQAAPAPKKPAAKKPAPPAAKPVAKPKPKLIHEVLGNEQLVGYEGQLGQMYTVGKDTALNVTLKKAEYSVKRINIGNYSYLPSGDEKFLVLHFAVHNPLKRAVNFTSGYLLFKAVDGSGVTRNALTDMGREVTNESVSYTLQPAQKVDVYAAVKVAAFGEVPKLIVQSRYDPEAPIVRYDLRGKVSKMAAPFGDESGVSSPRNIAGKVGVTYPVADSFDVRVDKVDYATGTLGGYEAEKGGRFAVAYVTITNRAPRPARYSASYFNAALKDSDGEKADYIAHLLKTSRDEESGAELAPGEEAKARFFWRVPNTVTAQTILLRDGYEKEGRVYAVEVAPAE